VNFDFTEREEAFRKEVQAWLEANLPDDLRGRAFAASRADAGEVRRLFPGTRVEVVRIKTTGDKITDAPLSKIGGKNLLDF